MTLATAVVLTTASKSVGRTCKAVSSRRGPRGCEVEGASGRGAYVETTRTETSARFALLRRLQGQVKPGAALSQRRPITLTKGQSP